ncbi:MAG: SPOR domain-containing protein, partial [Aestuariivirga sp.]|uniref:SPOR domain-containing protein n=1 Tax=Aestuariivirga sp. TaxID=2650926 RepID=UPI003018055C
VQGVSVRYAAGAAVTTDAQGQATLSLPTTVPDDGYGVVVATVGDKTAIMQVNAVRQTLRDQARWYVFDDRQVYQPGETMRVKGWVRRLTVSGAADLVSLRAGDTIDYIVTDAYGNQILKGTTKVRVQFIGPAPLNDNGGKHLMAMNTELERGTPNRSLIAAADRRRGKSSVANVTVAEAPPPKKASRAVAETVAYQPPPTPEAPAAASLTGDISYFIQLGSFSDGGNAARVRDQFASAWPVQFIELSGAAGPIYRVRIGPITDPDDAQTALADAQTAGFSDAHLIKMEAVQASLQ